MRFIWWQMQENQFRKTKKKALVWSYVCLDETNAVRWKRQHNQVVWTQNLQQKKMTIIKDGEKAPGKPMNN